MTPEATYHLGEKPVVHRREIPCPVCGEDSAEIVTLMKSMSGGVYHRDDAWHCDECATVFDSSGVIPCEEYGDGHDDDTNRDCGCRPGRPCWDCAGGGKDQWKERDQ